MNMKTLRITLDESLLAEVDRYAGARFKNRTEFVSQACAYFLRYLDEQQKEWAYKKGYERVPESAEMADASVRLLDEVLEKEEWS
jgi:metal-responsive CopG/Arc/MetJ family transcriptional regulator